MSARDKQLSHLSIFFKSTSILTGSNFCIKNLTIFHEYLLTITGNVVNDTCSFINPFLEEEKKGVT
jgi:hypothetical protein